MVDIKVGVVAFGGAGEFGQKRWHGRCPTESSCKDQLLRCRRLVVSKNHTIKYAFSVCRFDRKDSCDSLLTNLDGFDTRCSFYDLLAHENVIRQCMDVAQPLADGGS